MSETHNSVELVYCQSCDKQSSVVCHYQEKEASIIWIVIWLFLFFPVAIYIFWMNQQFNKDEKIKGCSLALLDAECKHCKEKSLIKLR